MPRKGYRQTKQHKRKIKKNHADFSGKKHPFYGKKHKLSVIQRMRKRKRGRNNPKWSEKVLIICQYCGKTKYVIPSYAKRAKFCSFLCAVYAKTGENHYNWKGGVSGELYSTEWTETLREAIRQRDNYTCQECGIHQDELKGWNKKLDVHHIDYDKDNCDPNNLISLCKKCHGKTNQNRKYWTNYFLKNILHITH